MKSGLKGCFTLMKNLLYNIKFLKEENQMIFRFVVLSAGLSILSSCSHFIKTNSLHGQRTISHKEIVSSTAYHNLNRNYKSPYGEIPMSSHPDVDKWINYFTGRGRDYMQLYLERSSRYILLMKSVLQENNLPLDLVYVALIESGFSPKALSRANAVGYWQFIYSTGKRFGLRIDGYVDERRDPVLSTRAAANFFKDLYALFESWPLALASYNAGEHRINRAVLRYYNRDFWFLSSKKALPRETRNYIPKLIAAIHISKNPKKYGFHTLNYQPPITYELVKVQKPISLVKLAKNMGVSLEAMRALNPMYKGEYVPVYEAETIIRVPVGTLSVARAALEKSRMKKPRHSYNYHYWYRVRRGDNLYKIARRHKSTVYKIRKENNLGRSSLIRVGQRLKIPTRRLVASQSSSSKRSSVSANKNFHIVKKGQTLNHIARLYNLKVSQLKQLNNIQGTSVIYPKQKLKIKGASSGSQKKTKYHVVRKGDTLIGISKKYNISLPKLMKVNSIGFKSVLLTGTRLIIPN